MVGSITRPMNSRQLVSSWYMKKKNGLLTMKVVGKEYGVIPVVVAAAAVVPVSSTSITALCSTCDFTIYIKLIIWKLQLCWYSMVSLKTNL